LEDDLNTDLRVLESHLDSMLDSVRHNSTTLKRFQAFERRLLDLNSLSEMIGYVLHDGKAFFDLDVISFCLVEQEGPLTDYLAEDGFDVNGIKELILLKDKHLLKSTFGFVVKPYIGAYKHARCADFFSHADKKPVSVAIIPLIRRGKFLGSLNFGSFHSNRFANTMATDFIEHMVSVVSTCLENNLNFEMMRRTSFIDTLTGVNNRRFLEQRLAEEIDRNQRNGEALGCLFLDIDFFKVINDTYGHQAGDHVLVIVAATIKKCLRNNDVLARYGGEEFVALLSGLDETMLQTIAERIRASVQALDIEWDGQRIQVTLSIGTATYAPPAAVACATSEIAANLIEAADSALYRAKHKGRNRVESNGLIKADSAQKQRA